jgi:PAS domain S-box-containing protein
MITRFVLRIALPALLTFTLFCLTSFGILIPAIEKSVIERKREMILELTVSSWNILASFEQEVQEGKLTREQAQYEAVRQFRNLHYGPQLKDYFWINDLGPRMVVHPYRHDLEGQDISDIRDPDGKRLFVEFVEVVKAHGAGFVRYRWQRMDDPTRIVPKLSYVKLFEPWGWVIGTGVYLEDVGEEIDAVTQRLLFYSCIILGVVSLLLLLMLHHGLRVERLNRAAADALRASEERYRMLVESAGESIIMAMGQDRLYANANALQLLGYSAEQFGALRLRDLIRPAGTGAEIEELGGAVRSASEGPSPAKHECELVARDGRTIPVMLACSPITVAGRDGVIVVATDITERKRQEEAQDRQRNTLEERMDRLHQHQSVREETLRSVQTALLLLQTPEGHEALGEFVRRLRAAQDPAELIELNRHLPTLIQALMASGLRAEAVNRFITVNSDTVLEMLIGFALQRLGPPPVDFAFLIMGSEGRREQTLCTDQDNALLFADPEAGQSAAVMGYFQRLGEQTCALLNDAGYAFCTGEMMARNPAWCQPLSAWQRHFTTWLRTIEAQDLLQAKVFFDFRCGYGNAALLHPLGETLREELAASPRFFAQLALNVLHVQPPLGLFGGIAVQTVGEHRGVVDIKGAMTPIVDFARIYALRQGLSARNTVERLHGLLAADVLTAENHDEIVQVYQALMQIRLDHQVRALGAKRAPDNLVEPSHLTHLQRRILRESFAQIRNFQTRLGYDFTGLPGGFQ